MSMKMQLRQLLEEQLPIRASQLLDVYGPEGIQPLLPERQSTIEPAVPLMPSQAAASPRVNNKASLSSHLRVGLGLGSKSTSRTPCEAPFHVWISSRGGKDPTNEAIDLSGWRLRGSFNFTLPQGTVSRIAVKGLPVK